MSGTDGPVEMSWFGCGEVTVMEKAEMKEKMRTCLELWPLKNFGSCILTT